MTKKKKCKLKLQPLVGLVYLICSLYFIYRLFLLTEIEKLLYIIIIIILVTNILLIIKILKNKKQKQYIYVLALIFSFVLVYLGNTINKLYEILDNVNKKYVDYSTSLIVLNNSNIENINDIINMNIGILTDTSSIEGHTLPFEIIQNEKLIDNNKIIKEEDYTILITKLYNQELEAIFLPTNYDFSNIDKIEEFKDIEDNIKTIYTKTKEIKKNNFLSTSKKLTEPFTILLIGIDSTTEGLNNADSFNGDSLILVTFNPTTLNTTMLSIPRDSYVPIACFTNQIENKITHAAARGTNCVIETIQNFTGIKIDYYAKINFKGVVDLVDAVNGIEVDVPYSFCEQNSKRKWGKNTVYVKKGIQILNGEEALALSRNRKYNYNKCNGTEWFEGTRSDFVRGKNQQLVIQSIVNKIKSINNIDTVYDILNAISNNMDTNMSTSTILSFYDVLKDILLSSNSDNQLFKVQKLELTGIGQTIYDERTGLNLWNYVLNKNSIEDVVNAMKINLELEKNKINKDFTFSINDPYSIVTIGTGPYSTNTSYALLPSLINHSKEEVLAWAQQVKLQVKIIEVFNNNLKNGIVVSQNYPVNKRIDLIPNNTITIEVVSNNINSNKLDCMLDENINNKVCIIPDFVGKTKKDVEQWAEKFSNTISVNFEYVYNPEYIDKIISHTPLQGTTINSLISSNTTIIFKVGTNKSF